MGTSGERTVLKVTVRLSPAQRRRRAKPDPKRTWRRIVVRIYHILFEKGTYQEPDFRSKETTRPVRVPASLLAKTTTDGEENPPIQELEKFSYITLSTKSNTSPQIELLGTAQSRKNAKRVIPAGLLPRALFLHNHHQPSHSFIPFTFPSYTITRPGRMS